MLTGKSNHNSNIEWQAVEGLAAMEDQLANGGKHGGYEEEVAKGE